MLSSLVNLSPKFKNVQRSSVSLLKHGKKDCILSSLYELSVVWLGADDSAMLVYDLFISIRTDLTWTSLGPFTFANAIVTCNLRVKLLVSLNVPTWLYVMCWITKQESKRNTSSLNGSSFLSALSLHEISLMKTMTVFIREY